MTIKVTLTKVWIQILLNVVLFSFTDSILKTVIVLMRVKSGWQHVNTYLFVFARDCVTNLNIKILNTFIQALHIYFLLVWVIECLITGLELKMAYLWLQSHSATFCLMIMSVCTNTCYYIFFCITKTLQNVKFIHVYKSPVIRAEAT